MRHRPAGEKLIILIPLISLTFFKILRGKNHETQKILPVSQCSFYLVSSADTLPVSLCHASFCGR